MPSHPLAPKHHRRCVRVLRRDLDQLIADAEAASRVHEPTALDEGDEKGWRDARQFWGGE